MSVINTNVKSIVAQNALTVNNRSLGKTMEQLSTGQRINGAADDAAGLAISSKMTSQIRGLNQAVRNANDGISLMQTAEGALVEQTNMLQRMRELAVQASNDTNTTEQRGYLDLEFQQLKAEINRIGSNTQWNGMNILDKSFSGGSGEFKFQVGANADQTISRVIGDFRTQGTATGTLAVATGTGAATAAKQSSTIKFTGFATGDVISVNVGDKNIQYTVKAADNTDTLLATAVKSAIGTVSGVTVTDAADTLTFAATNNNTPFQISATAGGLLGNVNGSSITDQPKSNSSIGAIDLALKTINNARAEMGSTINRLNYAADNLSNVSMNTSASRSRILDTDYASATTELARSQIIQQAATAMLAQANQQPQSVLSLLK